MTSLVCLLAENKGTEAVAPAAVRPDVVTDEVERTTEITVVAVTTGHEHSP